jgi:flagellar basal-body rod modification protein FlgD
MIGSVTSPTTSSTNTSFSVSSKQYLDLFITEMQNQDPMQPLSNKDMLEQFAQLTSVQLMTDLSTSIGGMTKQNQILTASGMLGKTIEYTGANGQTSSAVVTDARVDAKGAVQIGVSNGDIIALDKVTRITS